MAIEEKSDEIRYLTHMIVFPDGDTLVEQKQFIHDLQFEAGNWIHTIFHHQDNPKQLATELIKKGELVVKTPYPRGGQLTHVYSIEDKQRPVGWLITKE